MTVKLSTGTRRGEGAAASPGERGGVFDPIPPTHSTPTVTRRGVGASDDTSMPAPTVIRIKVPFSSEPVPIDGDRAWHGLNVPTRERLRDRLRDIDVVDGAPVYRRGSDAGGSAWAAAVERAGNPLRAAVQRWGNGGSNEQLLDVLRLAGLPAELLRVDRRPEEFER